MACSGGSTRRVQDQQDLPSHGTDEELVGTSSEAAPSAESRTGLKSVDDILALNTSVTAARENYRKALRSLEAFLLAKGGRDIGEFLTMSDQEQHDLSSEFLEKNPNRFQLARAALTNAGVTGIVRERKRPQRKPLPGQLTFALKPPSNRK